MALTGSSAQGLTRPQSRCWLGLGFLNEAPSFSPGHVVIGWIEFLAVIGIKSPFSYWLLARECPQHQEAEPCVLAMWLSLLGHNMVFFFNAKRSNLLFWIYLIPFRVSLVAQMVKRICLQCRRPVFDPWVGKIPWRREWLPTPVFLPGESHRQKRLAGYSPWNCKESDTTEQLTFSLSFF